MPKKNVNDPPKSELKPLTADTDLSSDLSANETPSQFIDSCNPKGQTSPLDSGISQSSPLSIAATARVNRVNHWRNHEFAVGLVEPTWADEINRSTHSDYDSDTEANGPNRECCSDAGNKEMDPTCGCLAITGHVCGKLGYRRIGNMVILREGYEEIVNSKGEHVRRRKINMVVGPYWPMLVFVTYPLILFVSFCAAVKGVFIVNFNPLVVCSWTILTTGLVVSLFFTSCTDPGILRKHEEPPKGESSGRWRWNDRVQSYVPTGAVYDIDCAVVVEGFDHT